MAEASSRTSRFLAEEYRAAEAATNAGQIKKAWRHLERAHVVAQTQFALHLQSHWRMLLLAVRTRDGREAFGQLVRLALAPLGNLIGRLPIGNTGRSNVSAFVPMDIPPDLSAILDPKAD